jgi:hypothetical protein
MKKVVIERKVAQWDELTTEQQEAEIEKLSNEKYGLQVFFDGAYACYDYTLQDIEKETLQEDPVKYKAVQFERNKLYWQSGSQGWYYDHCGPPDFLTYKAFYKSTKRYTLELQEGYMYRPEKGNEYAGCFDWYLSLTCNGDTYACSGEFADIQQEFENNGWDIPITVIRQVKKHEKQYLEEFKELKKRVEDEIRAYEQYWPDVEEIAEFFRNSETEFVIEENEAARIAL